jgi:CelD/BcsL family acetyltransferase involved in cellulose biosynthesis
MIIDVIDDMAQFDRLQSNWNTVYAADNNAQVFLSWPWLRAYLTVTPYTWFVLALRSDESSSHVAFLPLARNVVRRASIPIERALHMGGNPLADFTGLLCMPECESVATTMFAEHVQDRLVWDKFHASDVYDARFQASLQQFPADRFSTTNTDKVPCPYIVLPSTWEEYCSSYLGATTRQLIRRRMRQVESLPQYRVSDAHVDNLDQHIETLLWLNHLRWGQDLATFRRTFTGFFRACFSTGCLWLRVIWDGETPVAALAAFVDVIKGTFSYYMGGFNPKYQKISPGKAMTGHCIRYAIENGFTTFDFLRGGEEYKRSFGSRERIGESVVISRRNFRNALVSATRLMLKGRRREKTAR